MTATSRISLRTLLGVLLLAAAPLQPAAHSGKARFHAIVDTDAAADDLRTLCMLLGNREIEVLAVTSSEGALPPDEGARRVRALLDGFHHEGIPVGAGRAVGSPAPPWRLRSRRIDWGETAACDTLPSAQEVIAAALENEEERVVCLALGALTNVADLLDGRPDLKGRIDRVIWYSDSAQPLSDANYLADSAAARRVFRSGVPVYAVSADAGHPLAVTPALLDTIRSIPTVYARKIAQTHGAPPLAELVGKGHLKVWDELTALYLFAPELFSCRETGSGAIACTLAGDVAAGQAAARLSAILRGKPDSESRVFYGFPMRRDLYAADVAPLIDSTIARHGLSEWRAGVLTNELHGHLGIYATIGVKMGIRAREYFNIGVDDIRVTSFAGSNPPVSCLNDGLQVGTGATVGHGLIAVAQSGPVRPEARFTFKGKTIRLALKPACAARIRDDVKRGIERCGGLTESYWQYVRGLALQYWRDWDRHEIFELVVEE